MTSGQKRFPCAPSVFKFASVRPVRSLARASCCRTSPKIVDDITIVKTVHTEAINHDPAITYIQTGSQIPGRPSMGAWASYGIGSPNENLPSFVVLVSRLLERGDTAGSLLAAVGLGLPADAARRRQPRGPRATRSCI